MHTNRGAPTPPIAFGPGEVGDRLDSDRIQVDPALRERLEETGADVVDDPGALAEASRDWWPLAMIWALDGLVAALASVIVRPHDVGEVSAVLSACNDARVPVTAVAGRSGVCGATVPVFGGVLLDTTALDGITGTYYPAPYHDRAQANFWGGNKPSASWMTRDDILAAFSHFGFDEIEIITEDQDAEPGPTITFAARRKGKS